MKKLLVSVLAFAGVCLSAGAASASYLCDVTFTPGSTTRGTNGYVSLSWYSGADCTGTFQGGGFICSSGATFSLCASDAQYRATSDAEIAAIAAMLANAATLNGPVSVPFVSCIGGTNCVGLVYFK